MDAGKVTELTPVVPLLPLVLADEPLPRGNKDIDPDTARMAGSMTPLATDC